MLLIRIILGAALLAVMYWLVIDWAYSRSDR